jgi:hypothetical protein
MDYLVAYKYLFVHDLASEIKSKAPNYSNGVELALNLVELFF